MRKIALFQSNYIPWKGFFDIINDVDVFVFYDDVQYTKRSWRTRNMIKSKNGTLWLSVPVVNDNLRDKMIFEVEVDNSQQWQQKHYKSITLSYANSPYLNDFIDKLEIVYLQNSWTNLSEMNQFIIKMICEHLGIKTEFINVKDLNVSGARNGERVINVCKKLDCDHVINGPTARDYMDQDLFDAAGVTIEYKNYEYPTYRQLGLPFEHSVSVIDLILNTGPDAPYYIWGWRES